MVKNGSQRIVLGEELAEGENLIGICRKYTQRDSDVWILKVELREWREDEYWETMYDN
jgi:hypothetical protein